MHVCVSNLLHYTHTHTFNLYAVSSVTLLTSQNGSIVFLFLGCWAGIHSNICIEFLLYCRHCGRVMKIQRWIKMWILLPSSLQPPEEGGTINHRVEGSANRNTICIGLVKSSFGFFQMILWKSMNVLFNQPNTACFETLEEGEKSLG